MDRHTLCLFRPGSCLAVRKAKQKKESDLLLEVALFFLT